VILNEHYERIIHIILEKKKGRCWKGYKPTPGVKPYAKGSCQPVSEGKTPISRLEMAINYLKKNC
jgi:hypothetical protein